MKQLKILTALVGVCIAGEVICLGGTIYTAVRRHHYEVENTPTNIVVPAGIPVPAIGK
jgi:hypothetical protein